MATHTPSQSNGSLLGLAPARTIPPFRLPAERLPQDQEWIDVLIDGRWQRKRLHDYHELYNIPGLYEALFNRTLRCSSPIRVVSLLQEVLAESGADPASLRVLDLGAGNGLVGHELRNLNVELVYGVDIIPEAKAAALRDRPWCYDDYFVADFTDLPASLVAAIRGARINALTCVAALGFGDIPTRAFLNAIDLLETPAYLAFNIKEDFVQERDRSGFSGLIRQLAARGVIQMEAYRRYQHRLACNGDPLHYIAMVATKQTAVPADLLA